jgi:thiol:disulfide interchange protein
VGNALEILLLALASMFWPTLIVIVVLALRLPNPVKILFWFLIGGLLTTITIGTVLVFALQDASFFSGSSPSADPVLDIVIGLLSLVGAALIERGHRRARTAPPPPEPDPAAEHKPSAAERAVGSGAVGAFGAGIVLNIVPGTFPIVALKDIAELDARNVTKFVAIVVFYVIMFAFVEVPLLAYRFAPERTTTTMTALNAWLGRNGRRVVAAVLGVIGVYLIVRGLVAA